MFSVPVTYLYEFEHISEKMRPYVMAEFARYGAKHLVLSDVLIQQIMGGDGLEDQLLKEMGNAGKLFCLCKKMTTQKNV